MFVDLMIFDRHKLTVNYYRLQRCWGKVMFLHVSVILFTRGVVSQHTLQQVSRGVVSQHALQVVSQHALQQVSGVSQNALQVSRSIPKGEVEGSGWGGVSRPTPGGWCLQVHTWGVSRPTPRGGLSRPTPGGGLEAPTQGEEGGLQSHTRVVSRPTTRGSPDPHLGGILACTDGYFCGQYASYWNAFLF